MKKGFAKEFIGFLVVIISAVLLFFFFTSQSVLKGSEVSRSVRGRSLDEIANLALITLSNNEPKTFDKTYMEIAVDAIYQGDNKTIVYYGPGAGVASAKELITSHLNDYIGKDRWELKIKTSKIDVSYGSEMEDREDVYSYEARLPLPRKKTGSVILYVA